MYDRVVSSLKVQGRILGRSRFFSSVVLVPFMMVDGEWHLVFQKRADNIRQGGEVSFPGGGFDTGKDKSIEDTAIRETVEELGIAPEAIQLDGHLGTLVAPMGAMVDVCVGRILLDGIGSFNINRAEVEEAFTVPLREFSDANCETYRVCLEIHPRRRTSSGDELIFPARELGLPERYHGSWGGKLYEVYLYRTSGGIIWGLTAEIIKDMLEIASVSME